MLHFREEMLPELRHFGRSGFPDGIELAETPAFLVADGFEMLASAGPSIRSRASDIGGDIGIETKISRLVEVLGGCDCVKRYGHCFPTVYDGTVNTG